MSVSRERKVILENEDAVEKSDRLGLLDHLVSLEMVVILVFLVGW